jgi:predicted HTH transcriptional regulator
MRRKEAGRTLESVQRYGKDIEEAVVGLDVETAMVLPMGTLEEVQVQAVKEKILAILVEPKEQKQIRELVEAKGTHIIRALKELVETEQVRKTGNGKKGDPYLFEKNSFPDFPVISGK